MKTTSRFYRALVIVFILSFFGLTLTATSETIRVCEIDCEYNTIGDAIRDSQSEDTIRVQNGNYEENLRIDKEVTLAGTSSRWVRINPARNDRPTVQVGPSSVSVTFKDLTVSSGEGTGNTGILVRGKANLSVEDGIVRGAGSGLRSLDSAAVELKGVEIRGAVEAVATRNSSRLVSHNGLIREAGTGFVTSDSSELTVIGTEISESSKTGIIGEDTGKINVLSSTISNNQGPGIKLLDFSRLEMEESQVKSNGGGGLLLNDSANVRLTKNVLSYNDSVNLGIISKECGFSGPIEGFFGEVEGTGNDIVPADSDSICPERFSRVTSNEGGGYSYPFKPSTYAFVGLIGAASLIFLFSSL